MATRPQEVVTYQGKIIAKSKSATLLAIVPEGQEFSSQALDTNDYDKVWFPLSQTVKMNENFSLINNTLDVLVVTKWIAVQKGLV